MNITNKRIVLTGAASGIGRAALEALSHYDARIMAVDLNQSGLEDAIAALPDSAATITPYACDLSEQANVDALFAEAVSSMGGVDLFIANAGFAYYEKLAEADWDHIERIYKLNVYSPLYSILKMQELNGSAPYKVVVTASAMGLMTLTGYAIYGSTKGAVHRFAEGYRFELDDPSKLMLIYPIGTRTNFFAAANERDIPRPWPTQTPDAVARAMIRGIERDKQAVYPSLFHRTFTIVERVLPFARSFEHWLEKRRFDRWLQEQSVE